MAEWLGRWTLNLEVSGSDHLAGVVSLRRKRISVVGTYHPKGILE